MILDSFSWFPVFSTVEMLAAQAIAPVLVIGSYFLARHQTILMLPNQRAAKTDSYRCADFIGVFEQKTYWNWQGKWLYFD